MNWDLLWIAATCVGLAVASYAIVRTALAGRLGADVIALMALIGTLAVGEHVAGAVITAMLITGQVLESRAGSRAERELRALLERQPHTARRRVGDVVEVVPLESVEVGDLLVIAAADVIPVDGALTTSSAELDESALTGEPLPVTRAEGDEIRSGVVNAGSPFEMRATTTAADSTYAALTRLVRDAGATGAPVVRTADRFAWVLLLVTLALGGAAWALSGEAGRAVAVLVVATPCPLILAVPVAISSGLSRSARRGVVIKGGATLERLADARTLLLDKTGTLTVGHPVVTQVVSDESTTEHEVLGWAASLDRLSTHVIAGAIVREAVRRGSPIGVTTGAEESAGHGLGGMVDGRPVRIGTGGWLEVDESAAWVRSVRRRARIDGATVVFVSVDDLAVGAILLADRIRPDARRTIRQLRHDGIERVVMVSGDRPEAAEAVGAIAGVDEVLAEQTPSQKVDAVLRERRSAVTVMVGDGINDAPALAAADVGVAMSGSGSTAASEAADILLTVPRVDRLGEAMAIATRARRIALQSVAIGMGLSGLAMVAAALGWLPAAWGALLQEVIDVLAIGNALRVLRPSDTGPRLVGADAALARRFDAEHAVLHPLVDRLAAIADEIGGTDAPRAADLMAEAQRLMNDEILPHELAEDAELYPRIDSALGGSDPTGTMSRTHVEIGRLAARLDDTLDRIEGLPADEEVGEARGLLYGLAAVLELHFAQEEENYLSLADPASGDPPPV